MLLRLVVQDLLSLLLVHYRYIFARDPCFFSRIVNINEEPKEPTFASLWVFYFF